VQVCIAFALHRQIAVIPNTAKLDEIKDNFKATQASLTNAELEKIEKLARTVEFSRYDQVCCHWLKTYYSILEKVVKNTKYMYILYNIRHWDRGL